MNRDRLQGICKQVGGGLKQGWGKLNKDPYAFAAGTRDMLDGKIQEQRGISKEQADRQLADFLRRNRSWWRIPGR